MLDDLRTTGQNIYSVTSGGVPFYYAAALGFRTGDTDTVSGNLFRWEIEVYSSPTVGGFGLCGAASPSTAECFSCADKRRVTINAEDFAG